MLYKITSRDVLNILQYCEDIYLLSDISQYHNKASVIILLIANLKNYPRRIVKSTHCNWKKHVK